MKVVYIYLFLAALGFILYMMVRNTRERLAYAVRRVRG